VLGGCVDVGGGWVAVLGGDVEVPVGTGGGPQGWKLSDFAFVGLPATSISTRIELASAGVADTSSGPKLCGPGPSTFSVWLAPGTGSQSLLPGTWYVTKTSITWLPASAVIEPLTVDPSLQEATTLQESLPVSCTSSTSSTPATDKFIPTQRNGPRFIALSPVAGKALTAGRRLVLLTQDGSR
jgi:hypothetical protein